MSKTVKADLPAEPRLARPLSVPLATTKAEAVYVETRFLILRGVLAPGSAVNQEALAAKFGLSITPLREALRRLEMEGLIRLAAHRTVVIAPLTGKELDELYVIREELDPLAARMAAAGALRAQIDEISRLARQPAVREPVLQLERNRAFHRAIYSACGNGALIMLLDQLWDRTDRYRLILVTEEIMEGPSSQRDHIDMAAAIAAGDVAQAAQLMRDHIVRSHQRIAAVIEEIAAGEPWKKAAATLVIR
jgi:DNA-binding GntR family transcriptional regulator